jgi:hypothetical protein
VGNAHTSVADAGGTIDMTNPPQDYVG